MTQLVLKHNLTPAQWTNCTNILLEKDPGERKINRLRIIQLLEFDLNLIYKLIWSRQLTYHAEDSQAISQEAYGVCPGKREILAVLNKVSTYDIFRLQKPRGMAFDTDTIGCFDRIVP